MKKIIASKRNLVGYSGVIVLFGFISILCLFETFGSILGQKPADWVTLGAGLLWSAIFLGISALAITVINRSCCRIWLEEGKIKRKGFFGGFYKECDVKDIKWVKEGYVRYMGRCIFLMDDSPHKFNYLRKDSYICFVKSKYSLEFLRNFWEWPLEEVREWI